MPLTAKFFECVAALVRKLTDTLPKPVFSLILPASNEEAEIGPCLESILAADWNNPDPVECIVIANGCTDETVARARDYASGFERRGWQLTVLDVAQGGKLNALNLGDETAQAEIRAYIDADVRLSPLLLHQLYRALDTNQARYASGNCVIAPAKTWASRAYRRIYRQVPFMAHGVPGCGIFAVNGQGRARWNDFPQIISDDTYVRLSFSPEERIGVAADYHWPIVEGFGNLVKVRRRQERGVEEIEEKFPHLFENDDKLPFPTKDKLRMALKDPIGFAVYSGVALVVRLTQTEATQWSRGR